VRRPCLELCSAATCSATHGAADSVVVACVAAEPRPGWVRVRGFCRRLSISSRWLRVAVCRPGFGHVAEAVVLVRLPGVRAPRPGVLRSYRLSLACYRRARRGAGHAGAHVALRRPRRRRAPGRLPGCCLAGVAAPSCSAPWPPPRGPRFARRISRGRSRPCGRPRPGGRRVLSARSPRPWTRRGRGRPRAPRRRRESGRASGRWIPSRSRSGPGLRWPRSPPCASSAARSRWFPCAARSGHAIIGIAGVLLVGGVSARRLMPPLAGAVAWAFPWAPSLEACCSPVRRRGHRVRRAAAAGLARFAAVGLARGRMAVRARALRRARVDGSLGHYC